VSEKRACEGDGIAVESSDKSLLVFMCMHSHSHFCSDWVVHLPFVSSVCSGVCQVVAEGPELVMCLDDAREMQMNAR